MKVIKKIVTVFLFILLVNCADNDAYNESFFNRNFSLLEIDSESKDIAIMPNSNHYLFQAPVIGCLENKDSKILSKEIDKLCDYTKIPFKSIGNNDVKYLESTLASLKVIFINNTKELSNKDIEVLLEYVNNGGKLVITSLTKDSRLNYFIGINNSNKALEIDTNASGLYFNTDALPNLKNERFYKSLKHYGYSYDSFLPNISTIVSADSNKKYPVILENKIGRGKVLFFNSNLEINKELRGLLFSSALSCLEGIPYPVNNISTIFLDDFPAPTYAIVKEPIKSEFNNMLMSDFVNKIWWPDMKKMAKDLKIKYSATLTFTYDDNVTPPFLYNEWEEVKNIDNLPVTDQITFDLLRSNHEIAFHGFNHTSLLKNNWKEDHLSNALNSVRKNWIIKEFGAQPISYIPPSNHIDKFGINILNREMPSIKYICSNYLGDYSNGGNREFSPEYYNNKLFNYPRVSSGFVLDQANILDKESVYLFTGIWTHFVHPDDIYQIPSSENTTTRGNYDFRNAHSLNWYDKNGKKGFLSSFKNTLEKHQKNYPLNKFLTASKAGRLVNKWRNDSYTHFNLENSYKVEKVNKSISNKQNWFVYYSNNNLKIVTSYLKLKKLTYSSTPYLNGVLLNIKTSKQAIELPKVENNSEPLQEVLLAYNNSLIQEKKTKENFLVKEETLLSKIKKLRAKIFNSKVLDTADWNQYSMYKHWENKPNETWKDLNEYYIKTNNIKSISYSAELAKKVWYPTDSIYEVWLNRRYNFDNNNLELQKEYALYYNDSDDNSFKAISSLEEIASREPTKLNRENYIKRLIYSKDDYILSKLDAIKPSSVYSDMADEVAWYYYNKNNLIKSYDWAQYTNEIDMSVKLDWLYQTKQYKKLENVYTNHINNSPSDDKTKIAMVYLYRTLGEFKKAWMVAMSISSSHPQKEKLRQEFNNEVKYVSNSLQKDLLKNHNELFYKKIKDSLLESNRITSNDYVSFLGDIASDRNNTAFFDLTSSYTIRSKKNYNHTVTVANSNVYELKNIAIIDVDNINRELLGLGYQFRSPEKFKKINYWVGARLEKDLNQDNYFYRALGGASFSSDNYFISAQARVHPVRNGPSYSKSIYRNRIGVYYEQNFLKRKLSSSLYTEANYYSDNIYSNSNTLRAAFKLYKISNFVFSPFIEGQASFASINRNDSYPYWIIDNRYFGGGGLSLTYGKQNQSDIFFFADAAHFADSYTDEFTRFTGNTSIRFLKYFRLIGGFEYYHQSQFYSNRFNFGLNYHLK